MPDVASVYDLSGDVNILLGEHCDSEDSKAGNQFGDCCAFNLLVNFVILDCNQT